MLRIILIPVFVVMLANLQSPWGEAARWGALGIFAMMAVSDGLDGWLARRFHQTTPLGRFLDPFADKVLIASAMILLTLRETSVPGYSIPNWVVVGALGKDIFVVVGFLLVFIITGDVFIKPVAVGKACTDAQLALVLTTLLAPDIARQGPGATQGVAWLLLALYVLATALAVLAAVQYYRLGAHHTHTHTADRPPGHSP